MPSLEYFLVCESVSTDQETNRVSLFHILEDFQLASPGSPGVVLAQFAAVSCWNREEGDEERDFQALLRIHPPGGEAKEIAMNFRMERPRQRLTLRFLGIPKMEPGQLRFELLLNGRHVAWHTVNVFAPTESASEPLSARWPESSDSRQPV
jgi:hypothetical protein